MYREIPEKDWKVLRRLKPSLLDRLCDEVLNKIARITKDSKGRSHERYLKLWRFLREQDRVIGLAFNDHRRSTALAKVANIHSLGLFTDEEFAEFSEETREAVLVINR